MHRNCIIREVLCSHEYANIKIYKFSKEADRLILNPLQGYYFDGGGGSCTFLQLGANLRCAANTTDQPLKLIEFP